MCKNKLRKVAQLAHALAGQKLRIQEPQGTDRAVDVLYGRVIGYASRQGLIMQVQPDDFVTTPWSRGRGPQYAYEYWFEDYPYDSADLYYVLPIEIYDQNLPELCKYRADY